MVYFHGSSIIMLLLGAYIWALGQYGSSCKRASNLIKSQMGGQVPPLPPLRLRHWYPISHCSSHPMSHRHTRHPEIAPHISLCIRIPYILLSQVPWTVSCIPSVYTMQKCVQWNPFTPDTIGTTASVLISEVSLFQGLILYTFCIYLWQNQVSGFERCLDLRGVWIWGWPEWGVSLHSLQTHISSLLNL